MVIMASGITRGRVRTTATTESCNKGAILQIIGWQRHAALGRFPFDQNFRNFFWNGGKWYGNFQGKVPENPEIVEFPKSEPFNPKFWKFRYENQMERKFPGKYVRKFGYTSRGCPLFRKLYKFSIFYSALVLWAAIQRVGHLTQGWRRRVFENENT